MWMGEKAEKREGNDIWCDIWEKKKDKNVLLKTKEDLATHNKTITSIWKYVVWHLESCSNVFELRSTEDSLEFLKEEEGFPTLCPQAILCLLYAAERLTGWIMVLFIFQACINAIDLTCLFWRAIRAPLCCIYRLYCGLSLRHRHILHSTLPPSPRCYLAVNFIVKHQQERCVAYFCLRKQTTLC